jgi:hypothetical protein
MSFPLPFILLDSSSPLGNQVSHRLLYEVFPGLTLVHGSSVLAQIGTIPPSLIPTAAMVLVLNQRQ